MCKHLPIENRVNRVEQKLKTYFRIIPAVFLTIFRLQTNDNCETFRKKCINCRTNVKSFVYLYNNFRMDEI